MEKSTFDACRNVWKPEASFWQPYQTWEKEETTDIVQAAHEKWQKRVADCSEPLLDPALDKELNTFIEQYN